MSINVLDGTGGYDGKVSPRYLQRVVNRIVKYITDVTATPVDSRPYKVYTALISQSGTDAPVATVLENTLGGTVVWSRGFTGNYYGTLNGAFTENKVVIVNPFISWYDASGSDHYQVVITRFSDDAVRFVTGLPDGTEIDGILNGVLGFVSIEIRVYN